VVGLLGDAETDVEDVIQMMDYLTNEVGVDGIEEFLFGFLSRSQVTWNPSFTSVVKWANTMSPMSPAASSLRRASYAGA
jgi:hypothetical protein